jgi:adenylate cyclase
VIEEGDRIYGDGVNIAARLESLADPGGICVSKTAFDHIEAKLPLGYHFIGEQTVKNIAKPVGAYKVLMEPRVTGAEIKAPPALVWRRKPALAGVVAVLIVIIGVAVWNFYGRASKIEPASREKMAYPLPDKPSIAVLPFVNMSGDPAQDYIADGIAESIITALSRIQEMFVIARTSTFSYKGKPIKVQQVSEELGVRYVLEGSVQKEGDRIRITAQLIDALKGHHMWAEQYNRNIKDFFGLLDEMTTKIGSSIQAQLTGGDYARHIASTENFEAWGCVIKGYDFFRRATEKDIARARELFEKAVELDPAYVVAWRMLGYTHYTEAWIGYSKSPKQSIEKTFELAQKALSIDKSYAGGYALLADAHLLTRQHEKAITEGQRALDLDPNDPLGYIVMAKILHYSGRFEEAISMIKTAMRLHGPYFPAHYLVWLGAPLHMTGRNEEALPVFNNLLERSRRGEYPELYVQVNLAVVTLALGQEQEARKHAAEVLKLNPKFSLEWWSKMELFKDPALLERRLEPMRRAGLPETPPLPLPDKPSIAVLPFVNMSDDKSQEYFSDGLTEEIITALSKTPKLFVIARNSTFVYKGKPVNVQQVSRELGVKYVLEGSVRRSGDQLRITVQLIDATTGNHLWAERYDRKMKDVFAIQDEITMRITNAMQVALTTGEQARLLVIGTSNLEAYLKVLQGAELFMRSKVDNTKALELFKEAIAMDPDYPMAHAHLALAYSTGVWLGFASSPQDYLRRGLESAQKAISLNDASPIGHNALALCYLMNREHDKAISEGKKAVTLDPNGAWSNFWLGHILVFSGRPEEAIPYLQAAIRLDPFSGSAYFTHLCMAYREAGRYEEAIAAGQEAVRGMPNLLFARLALASTYNMVGRDEEARAEAAEALRIDPNFSLKDYAKARPHIDPENTARFVDSLRKAGLK